MVCEDMWTPDVSECLEESGAELLIVINGSPYELNKTEERVQLAVQRIVETGLPLIYVNQVGGQDELVFDGASFVLNADHSVAAQLPAFEEAVEITAWLRPETGRSSAAARRSPPEMGMRPRYRTPMRWSSSQRDTQHTPTSKHG